MERHRRFKSNLPEHPTLGMALVKAMDEYRSFLRRNHIDTTDWLDILRHNGKIRFTSGGAEIILPKPHPKPLKGVYIGE